MAEFHLDNGGMPQSSIERVRELKKVLLDEYGHFADRRVKNIDKGWHFIVDSRDQGGIAADGSFYGWFCSMRLEVQRHDCAILEIRNIPTSGAVADWLAAHAKPRSSEEFAIALEPSTVDSIGDLSSLLRAITAPGKRYDTPAYKYSVPRTVHSLEKLMGALARAWPVS